MLKLPEYPVRAAIPAWAADYIGIPYKLTGRTMEECDCWGLAMLVLADHFVPNPPRFEGVEWSVKSKGDHRREVGAFIDHATATLFDPVAPGMEMAGDIIILRISGNPLHVGIVVAPGVMLHSAEDADSAMERYDGVVWRHRVLGLHRLRGGADDRKAGEDAQA